MVLESERSACIGDREQRQDWRMSDQDALLADATAHLIEAYEVIDELSQKSSLPSMSPTLTNACRMLCATLLAIDEFSQLVWVEDCPNGTVRASSLSTGT